MKLLHTSDWHLGQSFFTQTRKAEHQAFLNWLLNVVNDEKVDALIVAGDIFDTGTPPSYAREMYNQFVVDLHQTGCALVLLGGNHDAVAVLNESRTLLGRLGAYVVASTGVSEQEQVITLTNREGEPGAVVCAIPFIRPKDILQSQAGETGVEKRQALGDAIKSHYQRLYEHARAMAAPHQIPVIATGHLTALGVSQSESVRDIYIGTLDGFSADGFPPADYIALGHIHRPQKVAGKAHIRYSGSPIALSFDELGRDKEVVMVTFEQGSTTPDITPLSVPRFQPMAVIRGDLKSISSQIDALKNSEQPVWLCIEVESEDYLTDLQERIQTLAQDAPVEVLQLKRLRSPKREALGQLANETLAELTPQEVFEKRLLEAGGEGNEESAERLRALFSETLAAVDEEKA